MVRSDRTWLGPVRWGRAGLGKERQGFILSSSEAEQVAVNHPVGGSNPSSGVVLRLF